MSKFRAFPLLIVLALVLAVLTYAFAASNTVNLSVAGDGKGTISGVTATVHYVLNNTDPTFIDTVELSLDKPVTKVSELMQPTVKVSLDDGGTWYNCSGAEQTWSCPLTPAKSVTVLSVSNLRVITAQ